jgi:hypothetical protein
MDKNNETLNNEILPIELGCVTGGAAPSGGFKKEYLDPPPQPNPGYESYMPAGSTSN